MEFLKNIPTQRKTEPESQVLYIVGTPIGNMKDISARCINLLAEVSLIACEDTRHTKKLLNGLKITNKLISFNEYNSEKKTEFIISKLKEGLSVALVSDAGLPVISDPGEYLVKSALKNNLEVICAPGACAALTSLVCSGMPSNNFLFIGFLPKKRKEKNNCLKLISESSFTTIIYESPKRIKSFLKELSEFCGENRLIHISKELTKKFEQHWNGELGSIIRKIDKIEPKGEFTIVIEGNQIKTNFPENNYSEIKFDLDELIRLGLKRRSAANFLARKNGLKKNTIYNLIENSQKT